MPEIPPTNEGPISFGSGKPEISPAVPEAAKKVDPLTPSTPEQLVDQLVQSSTKQQIAGLLREYVSANKKYLSSLGKAAGGVAVHEGVKTLQGARDIKMKEQDDKVMRVKRTIMKGRKILSDEDLDYENNVVTRSTFDVEELAGGAKRVTQTQSKGVAPPIIGLESGEPKKGFLGKLDAWYKAGNKRELDIEKKSKSQEKMIDAVGGYVTDTILKPYPDVPQVVTGLSEAVGGIFPDKGIQFIPAVWETAVALIKRGKTEIDISKRLWSVIKNSPEANGAKNNVDAVYRVVRSLFKKDINKMKTPEAQQAAAVFA